MIIYHAPELIAWAAHRMPLARFSPHARSIGYVRGGRIAAAAVFDLFEDHECEISFAAGARRWFTDDFARAVFAYPFIQLGHERLTCHVLASNRPARVLVRSLGFKPEGRSRRLDPARDRLMFGMLRHECRWVPPLAAKSVAHGTRT